MPKPVTGTVYFNVSVTSYHADPGKWMVQTVETGIVTYGASLAEAEARNGQANVMVVKAWKASGRLALDRFMKKHGIVDYRVDDTPGVAIPGDNYIPVERALELAA
ncbi:MAG: hypothetical protein IH609_16815 [Dehalococcoidia bacterium]|nr:hypothetical protein [Dehalococcoidia bacterium]